MRKLGILFVFFMLSYINIAFAQAYKLEKILAVEQKASSMAADNLGNIYLINEGTLKKLDAKGNLLYTYTEFSDGHISGVDVSDPLKIMIFNAGFGKIKYLDNKLALKKDFILLSELNYPNATLMSNSYENGLWLYDPLTNQIIRFNNKLQQVQSSGNISEIAQTDISPVSMVEANNNLYIYAPETGILVFDRYATYLKLLPFKNLCSFQVFLKDIFLVEANKIKIFNINTFEEAVISLPEEYEIISALCNNEHIYILTKTHLNIYSIKPE